MTLVEWTPRNSLLNYFSNIDRIFDNILPHSIDSENQVSYFTPSILTSIEPIAGTMHVSYPDILYSKD